MIYYHGHTDVFHFSIMATLWIPFLLLAGRVVSFVQRHLYIFIGIKSMLIYSYSFIVSLPTCRSDAQTVKVFSLKVIFHIFASSKPHKYLNTMSGLRAYSNANVQKCTCVYGKNESRLKQSDVHRRLVRKLSLSEIFAIVANRYEWKLYIVNWREVKRHPNNFAIFSLFPHIIVLFHSNKTANGIIYNIVNDDETKCKHNKSLLLLNRN